MTISRSLGCLSLAWVAASCGDAPPAAAAFAVRHVVPAVGGGESPMLFLNQPILVYFSDPIDPLSVTGDSFRVTDDRGHAVKGTLRVTTHSVSFQPDPPLRADLSDGSFKPSTGYRLEVIGFPRPSGVRSLDGRVLDRSVAAEFRTVSAAGGEGLGTPFLPEATDAPFALRREFLKMAADSSTLELSFSRPLLPGTVRPAAFEIYRVRAGRQEPERLAVVAARATSLPRDPLPGCSVLLSFAERPVVFGDHLFVRLAVGADALCDYGGEPVGDAASALSVPVLAGERVPIVELSMLDGEEIPPFSVGVLGFEKRAGRLVPRVRREAGTGRLGSFAPRESTTLYPGQPFDRGDGVVVRPNGGVFDFVDIRIPAGVEVVVRGGEEHDVLLRACGSIRIDGALVLDGTFLGQAQEPGAQRRTDELLEDACVSLLAGADLYIDGSIRHQPSQHDRDRGVSPVTLMCGGKLVFGRAAAIPPQTVLAAEGGWRQMSASVSSHAVPVVAWMTPAMPDAIDVQAAAATSWVALPQSYVGAVQPWVHDARGAVQVWIQIADSDPLDPTRPHDDPAALAAPIALPLDRTLFAPTGGFVRFLLRASVASNAPLPSLESLAVFAR
jgi:hypothetical protein